MNKVKYKGKEYNVVNGEIKSNNNITVSRGDLFNELFIKFLSQIEASELSDYIAMIEQAEKDIFIYGVGLTYLNNSDIMKKLIEKQDLQINIIISDTNNDNVQEVIRSINGTPKDKWSAYRIQLDDNIRKLKNNHKNTNVFNIFLISPISFFAIDVYKETDNSLIQCKFHSISNGKDEKPNDFHCRARIGTELFSYFKSQIEILKKEAEKGFPLIHILS